MKKLNLKDKIRKKKDEGIVKRKVKNDENGNSKNFRFWYWFLVVVMFLALVGFIGGIGFCYYIVKSAPEFDAQKMFEKEATRVLDFKGNLIASLGAEQRQKVSYGDLPQVLVDAIIATEDSRFFQHNGFDAPRFLKASISQVLGRGGGGASTLTMQLSKLSFTSVDATGIKGIIRKFTDIYMSVFKIERNFTKFEILEYYVNTPCMGGNIYGVQQASKYYFNKNVKDLNLVEAAQIAGMFQSPNGYNPYNNPNDANERKNTVLYLMKRHGYITETEYKAATAVEIKDFLEGGVTSTNEYQGFIDTVVQEVIDKTGNNPYDVPMTIYTTMDKSKQDVINNFYKNHKFKDSKVEVGVGVIDNNTGAILAVGAGRNKTGALTLNMATFWRQTKRQPGSTIKPIIDYGPAIEYANLSTYGPFIDDETPYGNGTMRNFNHRYSGVMSMRDCLVKSMNTCALQAFKMTSNDDKIKFITSIGIEPGEGVTTLPESYSIGAWNGVSPVQLAAAYSSFGSGGYYTSPYSFTKLVYTETGDEYTQDTTREKVMKPQTAYILSTVLQGVTPSTVKVKGTQLASKTGTTSYDSSFVRKFGLNDSVIPDMWTVTFSTDYSVAIWYGYPEWLTAEAVKNKHYLVNGPAITERKKIQAEINNKIHNGNKKFKNPGGIVSSEVEFETIPAQKPSQYTPSNLKKSYLFISGTEPSEVSNRFSKLNDPTNYTYSINGRTIELSWTSPGTPEAIDETYLTNYFNTGYTIWAQKYLDKRKSYNNNNIGNFGFAVYLTSGSSTTYVGWTQNTSMSIDLNKYSGYFDGVIIKSMYSKFKSNASDGIKILFDSDTPIGTKYEVSMLGLTYSYKIGENYKELGTSYINGITLNGSSILSSVTDLKVAATNVTNSSGKSISLSEITNEAGTYKVTYTITFTYNGVNTTKTKVQTVTVS
mgnify:CR=1 FL=1